ncbi:MAG: hypothetical protein DRJ65_01595, partial [Acidobacteria bacterium]
KHRDTESTEHTKESTDGVFCSALHADFVRPWQKRNGLQEPALVTRLFSAPARFACNRATGHAT